MLSPEATEEHPPIDFDET
jgi:hypothetical protein